MSKLRNLVLIAVPIVVIGLVLSWFLLSGNKTAGLRRVNGNGNADVSNSSPTPTFMQTSNGLLHVSGNALIDSNGGTVILRGAMMESAFAYIKRWQSGQDPATTLNSNTFKAMHSWNMNVIRINISQWIYQLSPTTYMGKLDQVVSQANDAGLYVVLDFHDDCQSGSPHCDGMLHRESLDWWKTIASHFANNGMILFDPINEPKYPDWNTWLNGNGDVVGFADIISAIRSAGARQIIVLEPGSAGKGNNSEDGGWTTFDMKYWPGDSNLMPSKHDYSNVVSKNPAFWDSQWGPLLNKYPIYYGEWAVLASADHPIHCKGLTSSNADQITNTFLNYLKSRRANWTYWDFEPYRLITNYTDFTPTSFATGAPWTCSSATSKQAGAGSVVRAFLLGQ